MDIKNLTLDQLTALKKQVEELESLKHKEERESALTTITNLIKKFEIKAEELYTQELNRNDYPSGEYLLLNGTKFEYIQGSKGFPPRKLLGSTRIKTFTEEEIQKLKEKN